MDCSEMEIKRVNIKKMGKEMNRDNLTGDKVVQEKV
jgi:hypothetical protein